MTASKHRIYSKIQLAAHHLKKHADRALTEAADLTTAQSAILVIVRADSSATQKSIANQMGLNESAMTAMVGRLVKNGLLEKTRSSTDRRAWRLSLTDKGTDALMEISSPFGDINAAIDSVITEEEMEAFSDMLERLNGVMAKQGDS